MNPRVLPASCRQTYRSTFAVRSKLLALHASFKAVRQFDTGPGRKTSRKTQPIERSFLEMTIQCGREP